jgi:hypothetical protein
MDESGKQVLGVKLVDFGSSFKFASDMDIKGTTPEYLAPEILGFILA